MAAKELANKDSSMLTQFSPRTVESDGNCFYRVASLGLYGPDDQHHYLRVRTAFELMRNHSFYDIDSPQFILPVGPALTSSYREVLRATLTDGKYAELIHIFALSAALQVTIQSYCCPDYENVRDD